MRRKTALEHMVAYPNCWTSASVKQARRELTALMAAAKGIEKAERMYFLPTKVHPLTYATSILPRLRRLGILKERK